MPDPNLTNEYSGAYLIRNPEPDTAYGVPELIQAECEWYEQFDAPIDREKEKTAMEYKNLALYAGSDKTYKVVVKDRNLNPINVYGGIGVMSWKKHKSDLPPMIVQKHTNIAGQGCLGDPTQGELIFYIVPTDTQALEARQYVFDVKLIQSTGKVYTVAEGVILLREPVNP